MVPFNRPWSFKRAAFAPDGASVLSDAGGKIHIYDVQTGKLSRVLTLPAKAAQVDFLPRQGDLVPVYMQDKSIAIVRIPK